MFSNILYISTKSIVCIYIQRCEENDVFCILYIHLHFCPFCNLQYLFYCLFIENEYFIPAIFYIAVLDMFTTVKKKKEKTK